jgi:carbonic anhydrase
MDARIDPTAAFGIGLGDAHVIRNAGGSARDALRSIIISEQLLGTREIVLVSHPGAINVHPRAAPVNMSDGEVFSGS